MTPPEWWEPGLALRDEPRLTIRMSTRDRDHWDAEWRRTTGDRVTTSAPSVDIALEQLAARLGRWAGREGRPVLYPLGTEAVPWLVRLGDQIGVGQTATLALASLVERLGDLADSKEAGR